MSRYHRIEAILNNNLHTEKLIIENESNKHNVPPNSETHFKLILVSEDFIPLKKIERHRLINKLLAEELQKGLHALSIHAYTPEEWKKNAQSIIASPHCKDGYKNRY
jgi:BolA protein